MWFKGFFMLHNFEGTVFDVCFASLLAIGLISLPFLLLVPPAIYLISAGGGVGKRHTVFQPLSRTILGGLLSFFLIIIFAASPQKPGKHRLFMGEATESGITVLFACLSSLLKT